MSRVFLSLGSNLGDRAAYLRSAISALGRGPSMELRGVSKVYETEPVEVDEDQPPYLNCVVELECGPPPVELLRYCQGIEAALGRERKGEKAPRTLDVDVLLFGEEELQEPDLVVPHPGIGRAFNLKGLADLNPELRIPGRGVAGKLLADMELDGIQEMGGGWAVLMAADIGNTQTVLGVFDGDEVRARWRLTTEASRTADEIGAVCATLLGLEGIEPRVVDALIVSSVVPRLVRSYEQLAANLFGCPFQSVGSETKTGLKNRYEDPAAVGADRIVNAVAAGRHYGFPAIIVDVGTATTVEAVDEDSNYLGGAILTGLYVALDALVSQTAKLPSVDLEERIPKAIATNTPDSIRSGFIYGYAGALDALIRRFRQELGPRNRIRVIATGGPAPVIVRHCQEIEVFDPDLTLKGLRILHEMNAE